MYLGLVSARSAPVLAAASNNLGDKKGNTKDILKLIQAHDGISKTEDLAKKFHKNAIISAKKIDNLKIQKEMIELAQLAYEREK